MGVSLETSRRMEAARQERAGLLAERKEIEANVRPGRCSECKADALFEFMLIYCNGAGSRKLLRLYVDYLKGIR